jgi:hypothetical protein
MLNIFMGLESFQVYKLFFGQRALALPIIFMFLVFSRSTISKKIKLGELIVYIFILLATVISSNSMEDLLYGTFKVLLVILCLELLSIDRTKELSLKIPVVSALLFVMVEFFLRYSSVGFDLVQVLGGSHELKLSTPFFSDTNGMAVYILLSYILLLSMVTSLISRILVVAFYFPLMFYTASVAGVLAFAASTGLYLLKYYPKFGRMLALITFVSLVTFATVFLDELVSYGLYSKLTHTLDIFWILSNNLKMFVIGDGVFTGNFYSDTGQYLHSYWSLLISSIGLAPSIVYIVLIYFKLKYACTELFVILPVLILSISYLNPFIEFLYFFLALINISLYRQEVGERNDNFKTL